MKLDPAVVQRFLDQLQSGGLSLTPTPEKLSANIAQHDDTFKKLMTLSESFIGASVTRDFKTLADVKPSNLKNILSDISAIENSSVVLAFKIAVIGTWNLSRDKELNINLPGHSNPTDCYNAALKFLDTEAEKTQIRERFLEAQDTPEGTTWFQEFYSAVETAKTVNKESLESSPAELREKAEKPEISILDRGPEQMSSLGKIVAVPLETIPFSKAALEERSLRIPKTNVEKTVQELLTAIYGASYDRIMEQTQVEDFSVALPVRPQEGSVEFLVKLHRQDYHQTVLMITGDNKLASFTLLPKNHDKISDPKNRLSAFCGAPSELDTLKESAFEASIIDVVTRERKGLLLKELSMSESCSVTFIMIPQRVVASIPDFNYSSSAPLTMSVTRGLHTSVSSHQTGASYQQSSDTLKVDTSRLPRIFRLKTFGL